MARRHLHFEVDQWRAMPWWKTRLYTEGLIEEFTPREEGVETVPPEEVGIVWA
jgi:hypothetical protein